MISWNNFLVFGKNTYLAEGHMPAKDLPNAFKQAVGKEAYYGIFDLEPRPTFKSYKGKHAPALGMYHFDFDDSQDNGELAKKDVARFIEWLELGDNDFALFYSGSKGFHVEVPEGILGFSHDEKLPLKLKKLLSNLSSKFQTLDPSVYNSARKFRAPFSKNPSTGLHKVPLTKDHLMLPIDEIKKIASASPSFFDIYSAINRDIKPSEKLLSEMYTEKQKELAEAKEKELSRHDKVVRFILMNESATSIEELSHMALQHDEEVNCKNIKGPYFKDKSYFKGKTPVEAARGLVKKVTDYKKDKMASKGVEWSIGNTDNLVFETDHFGNPVPNLDNVLRFLSANIKYKRTLWFDDFKKRTFFKLKSGEVREWNDFDDMELAIELQRDWNMPHLSITTAHHGAKSHAIRNRRNSITDWFDSLEWDGESRIERYFTDYMGAEDSNYTKKVSANFLISMVARAYCPGAKVDNMVIIEGPQGKFKSTANEVLVGPENFSEIAESIDSKDFLQNLQGKLLVEIAELDSFSKAEMTRVKQVITCRIDRYRPSYGRSAQDWPRMCVFVGTTNEDAYLNDPTGGRRFWPIKAHNINIEAIKNDREQLWAEAVYRYKDGESWWEVPHLETAMAQESRRLNDDWEDTIRMWLLDKHEVTTTEIVRGALDMDIQRLDQRVSRRVSRCMRVLGWGYWNVRIGGSVCKKWRSPLVTWNDAPRATTRATKNH